MKTPCKVQCPQCPFRPTSLPGYLGDYTVQSVHEALWHGSPFLCHTKVQYSSRVAVERAKRDGQLCLGGLTFANRMMAPTSGGDPEVIAARAAVLGRTDVEVMDPMAFGHHHNPATAGERFVALTSKPKPRNVRLPAAKVAADKLARKLKGRPTEKQIDAEVAALKALRPFVVPQSMFGDDNLASLDMQVRVLEQRMDERDIDDQFEPLNEDDEVEGDDNACVNADEGRTIERAMAAREVVQWMEGHSHDRPSEGWPLQA